MPVRVLTVIAYAIAGGVDLGLVIWSGLSGLAAAFLGGAVMGYMAEGVIVGKIYDPFPLTGSGRRWPGTR